MSLNLSVHNVTAIRLVDRERDGHSWVCLTIVSTDYSGKETEFEITAFPADKSKALRVDHPLRVAATDFSALFTPAGEWRDRLGHTASERQDIRDAGRGHLLP
jgi:hypothetical protein